MLGAMARFLPTALLLLTLACLGGCDAGTVPSDGSGDAATPAAASTSDAGTISGRVTQVIDGDTLHVTTDAGDRERVRLIGIDAPELSTTRTGYAECGGEEAFAELENRAPRGTRVDLALDAVQDHRDRFGRVLAYVTVSGQRSTLQERLLTDGWARVYVYDHRPFTRVDAFRRAAASARGAHVGVWSACGGRFDRPAR